MSLECHHEDSVEQLGEAREIIKSMMQGFLPFEKKTEALHVF